MGNWELATGDRGALRSTLWGADFEAMPIFTCANARYGFEKTVKGQRYVSYPTYSKKEGMQQKVSYLPVTRIDV